MTSIPDETQEDVADRLNREADRLENSRRAVDVAEARAAAEAARNAATPEDARRIEVALNAELERRARPNRNAARASAKMLSVVMATRNKASYLGLTLASLEHQLLPVDIWEVIVYDDASTDDTPDVLTAFEKRLPLMWHRGGSPRSRAGAWNEAIKLAQGRVLIFLDDVRMVPPGFLHWHMIHHLDGPRVVLGDVHHYIHTHVSPDVDADMWRLACLLRGEEIAKPANAAPRRFVRSGDITHPEWLAPLTVIRGKNRGPVFDYFDQQGVRNPFPWVYFSTGNASAPRDLVTTVKGLDESFRWRDVEDSDLAYRLHRSGIPFVYEPRALTFHQLQPLKPIQDTDRKRSLNTFFEKYPEVMRQELEPMLRGETTADEWHKKGQQSAPTQAPSRSSPPGQELCILWCCRGRGVGYAARDAALLRELRRAAPGARVRVLTYGPAFQYLTSQGFEVVNLGSAALQSARVRYQAFVREVRSLKPNLVVSDEELLALAVANAAGIRSVHLTNCLLSEKEHPDFGYTSFARQILFADTESVFEIPDDLKKKTAFCGPWVAEFKTPGQDWRTLLGAQDQPLVVVNLGASYADVHADAILARNSVEAVKTHSPRSRVVILGGLLTERLAKETGFATDVILNDVADPMGLLRCANVVLTRPDHALLWQLAGAGVPVIAIPRASRFSIHDMDYLSGSMKYARHMAALGSCVYLPDVIASAENLGVAIREVLETGLGPKLAEAPVNFDFAGKRRDTVARLLQVMTGG